MKIKKIINFLINPVFFFLNNLYSELSGLFPFIFPKAPLVLKVRITTKCNLECDFCYLKTGLNQNESGHMSIAEWENVLSKLPKRTIIDITGAEPFASPILKDFIVLINSLGLKFSITTNGTIYNKKLIEFVIDQNVSIIMISLDGMENTHNHLRGNESAFKRTNDFIHLVNQIKKEKNKKSPKITVKTTLLDENHLEIEDLVNHCQNQLEIDIFSFTLLFQNKARGGMDLFNELNDNELLTGNYARYKNPEAVYNSLENLWMKRSKWNFPIVIKPRIKFKNVKKYIYNPSDLNVGYCPQFKNNLTVYYNGDISPCDIALNLGNLKNYAYKIDNIYKSKKFLNFSDKMQPNHKVCQGCCNGVHKL